MPSHVSVKISGPAFRVTAYVINSKILKQLQSATEEDALYEDNPLSVVGNLALRSMRVANGFCIDSVDDFDVEVQIRAHADPVPAVAQLVGGELIVRPANPLNSVAAGQTAVIYVGTRVLGQFTIARTVSDLNVVATA